MPAYVETARGSWRDTALQCAAFSMGDAVLTWAIYAVAVTAARRMRSLTGLKFYLLGGAGRLRLGIVGPCFGTF